MPRLITLAVSITGVTLVCFSLLGFAGASYWIFDLFNHFRVQYLAIGTVGVTLAVILKSKRQTLILSGVVLLNLSLVAPLYFSRSEEPNSFSEISLVSYNTWSQNDDWESVLQILEKDDPDLAYFTETHPTIGESLRALDTRFQIFHLESDFLLVKKEAKLNPKIIGKSLGDRISGIPVNLTINGSNIALLAVHPTAPRSRMTSNQRDRSFDHIASFVEDYKGLVIVCGDLNATPWIHPFRDLQKRTGLINSQRSFGIQPTWPSYPGSWFNWLLRIPIDHCLHSPEVCTIDRRVGRAQKSNHNPLVVRLAIPTNRESQQ